jgi:hypothetical protein
MKNGKRILSVTVKRMIDECPDTSYLGAYGDRAKSDYAIDRAHDLDCASQAYNSQTVEAKRILEHVQQTLGDMQEDVRKANHDREFIHDNEWEALEDAYNEVGELLDNVSECDCGRGYWDHRSFQYFNGPVENYKGETPENIRKYILQDYERMEGLNNGQWVYIGILAEAQVSIPSGTSAVESEITSGGLWGTESDSEESYLESIEKEELADLKTQLKALGFSSRAISTAFRSIERKED